MMKLKTFKSLALTSMLVVSTMPSGQAQTIYPQTLPDPVLASQALPAQISPNRNLQRKVSPKFNCGPYLQTFIVRALDNRKGKGIRCVKLSEGRPGTPRIPKLAWYGEGNWQGKTYRHIGHAFYQRRQLRGYASDIYGNGEFFKNSFPGNLKVRIINPNRIRVTGAWNEEWIRVGMTNYRPLRRPRTCGRHFESYRVSDLIPRPKGRRGTGLRCVLRVGPGGTYMPRRYFTTWFGNGHWDGNRYSHLGTRSFNGHGASDICGTTFGPVCNTFGWGSLKMNPVPGGYNVTGSWREKWR